MSLSLYSKSHKSNARRFLRQNNEKNPNCFILRSFLHFCWRMAVWSSHVLCPWDHKPGWLLGKIVFWTLQWSRFSNAISFYSWKPVKTHNFQYFWSIQTSGGTDMYVLEFLKVLAFMLAKYWKPVICKDLWRKLYKCDCMLYQQVLSWVWGGTAPDQGRNLWEYQELKPSAYSISCKRLHRALIITVWIQF